MNQKKQSNFYDMYREENTSFAKENDDRLKKMSTMKSSSAQIITIRLFAILLICALGAALFGTFYFSSFGNRIDPLLFEMKGPQSLKSSETISFELPIKNRGNTPFTELALTVEYPEGFHFDHSSVDAANVDHTYWKIPRIKEGETFTLTISGSLVGNAADEKKIQAILHYTVGENGTEFISKKELVTRISSQLIPIEIKGPQLVEPTKEVSYVLTYGDTESVGTDTHILIKIQMPKQFTYQSTPQPDKDLSWSEAVLKKNLDQAKRSGEIMLKGTFEKDSTGDYEIRAVIETEKNGKFIVAQEKIFPIRIAHNPLSFSLNINGLPQIKPVSFGSEILLSLQYENKGADELKDVVITLGAESPLIDWSSLKNDSLGIVKDQTVTWTKKEFPQLEYIKPGQKGELTLGLKIKDTTAALQLLDKEKSLNTLGTVSFVTNAVMHISYNNDEKEIKNELTQSDIPLNSDVRVYITALKTDTPTQFSIQVDVENTFHEIKNIQLTLPLGSAVMWAEKATRSAGDITYDEASNSMVWTLNRLPLSTRVIHSTFSINVPTSQDMANTSFVLVQPTIFKAIDTVTQGTTMSQSSAVTIGDVNSSQSTH